MKLLKKPLKPHQSDAARFLLTKRTGILAHKTGSGKSYTSLAAAAYLIDRQLVDYVFYFLTPSSLVSVEDDIKALTNIPYKIIESVSDLVCMQPGSGVVYLLYYSRVRDYFDQIQRIMQGKRVVAVLDEIHFIKTPFNPRAFTKSLKVNPEKDPNVRFYFDRLRPFFQYCWGMTATPLYSKLDDVYNLVNYVRPGYLGTIFEFKKRYYEMKERTAKGGRHKFWEVIRYKNLEELAEKLLDVIHSYAADCDVQWHEIESSLGSEEDEAYLEAANGWFREEGEDTMHVVRMHDLQRVVDETWAKRNDLLNLVEQLHEKGVIIFFSYKESMHSISKLLFDNGYKDIRKITGEVDIKERKAIKEWLGPGKILLITKAGGQSLNLQSVNRFIFFNLPWGLGAFLQAMGRIVREFSDFKEFHIYVLKVKNSVDEYVWEYTSQNFQLLKALISSTDKFPIAEEPVRGSIYRHVLKKIRQRLLWRYGKKPKAKRNNGVAESDAGDSLHTDLQGS